MVGRCGGRREIRIRYLANQNRAGGRLGSISACDTYLSKTRRVPAGQLPRLHNLRNVVSICYLPMAVIHIRLLTLYYSKGSTMHRLPEELPNKSVEMMVLHNSDDGPSGIRTRQHFFARVHETAALEVRERPLNLFSLAFMAYQSALSLRHEADPLLIKAVVYSTPATNRIQLLI